MDCRVRNFHTHVWNFHAKELPQVSKTAHATSRKTTWLFPPNSDFDDLGYSKKFVERVIHSNEEKASRLIIIFVYLFSTMACMCIFFLCTEFPPRDFSVQTPVLKGPSSWFLTKVHHNKVVKDVVCLMCYYLDISSQSATPGRKAHFSSASWLMSKLFKDTNLCNTSFE